MKESAQRRAATLATGELVDSLATSWRPTALALVGGVGLAVILWLMIAQPG